MEITSTSEAHTMEIGFSIALYLRGNDFIPIVGPLGVGKSVLVRGIARGMGYDGRVRSPSFTIERIYQTPGGILHHWDLYRLEGTSEIEPLFDEIRMQDGIRVIEWGERLNEFLRGDYPKIEMEFLPDENHRLIRIDDDFGFDL
jgi:tRNA threonylcarbamoyladenosine biosynthesis protein TsaE